MKAKISIFLFIFLTFGSSWAKEFHVKTAAEIQAALTEAQGNGQEDCESIGPATPICTDLSFQGFPSIYGHKIVWHDLRNSASDIYMHDLSAGEEVAICTASDRQMLPEIFGDKIVWQDYRNGDCDIYMYELSTGQETSICTRSADQEHPSIYEDEIVYREPRVGGNFDIYLYDLSTTSETLIAENTGYGPAIYGNRIFWFNPRREIMMYDITTGEIEKIWTCTEVTWELATYGDILVWREGNKIYAYNLSSQESMPVCIDQPGCRAGISIFQDRVVWHDWRHDDADIYMYDLSTEQETPISCEPENQWYPAIYGDKIVWCDGRNGNYDIYMYSFKGDFDKDGDTDGSDLAVFAAAFGSANGDPNYNAYADFDNNGNVDDGDLTTFAADFSRTD